MQYMTTSLLRALSAVAAAAFTTAVLLPGSAAAAAPADDTVQIVALGDSYAAGTGAGDEKGDCRRTAGAYAQLWADTDPKQVSLDLAACSGAASSDVVTGQLDELGTDTDLVTVTVGSNDLGLVDALRLCVDAAQAQACAEKLAAIQTKLTTALPADLTVMLKAITTKAPKAKLVLTGYPVPFTDTPQCPGLPLRKELRDAGNNAIAGLNQVLEAAAKPAGASFAAVAPRFAGHDLCGSDPWLVGFGGVANETILHPTLKGQKDGYVKALESAVGTPEDVLRWIKDRDSAPSPSASPSAVPSAASPSASAPSTGDSGGSGGGLPVTGPNGWWLLTFGALLVAAGAVAYRVLRPKAVRVSSE
jgi:lysophospholipase L1-like esterase